MKLVLTVATVLAMASTAAFAAPTVKENQGIVAQATLAAKANAEPNVTGKTISDRNTNPENTYYEDHGFDGRGDEVSTLATGN